MPKPDVGRYVFEVKDGNVDDQGRHIGNESAWIYCQPTESELSIVGKGYLSIHVKPGTPEESVWKLARELRELGVTLKYTPPR